MPNDSPTGALLKLSEKAGVEFPYLREARSRTAKGLADLRSRFEEFECDDDVSIGLMGSWGRSEVTSGSDNDFVVLVDSNESFRRKSILPKLSDVRRVLKEVGKDPGREGTFGTYVYLDHLAGRIGLDQDDNTNLTRRTLLLLESVAISAEVRWSKAKEELLSEYMEQPLRPRRVPRFLLNDVVRYWRTVCVDFAGKQRERQGEGWGLRNAKLRLSRKALFAAGLLPVLRCHELAAADDIQPFLLAQFDAVPTDRLADAFLHYGHIDAGGRALSAYDEFLGILDDSAKRTTLDQAPRDELEDSRLFKEVRTLGKRFQDALVSLVFDSKSLAPIVREHGVF